MTKFESNLPAVIEELQNKDVAQDAKAVDLQNQIDIEIANRTNADVQLQSNIDAEVNTRTIADQSLQDQITAEIITRTSVDETESSTRADADKNLQDQIDELKRANFSPAGVIQYFALQTAPEGWLEANGAVVSRSQYANLFAAISTTFGVGDGSATFKLPDLRGEFIRGFDNGRGVDTGRTLGSTQAEGTRAHAHPIETNYNDYYAGTGNGGPFRLTGNDGTVATDGHSDFITSTMSSTGSETRPRNVALLACIKY
jgi:microcystin-dependent protein